MLAKRRTERKIREESCLNESREQGGCISHRFWPALEGVERGSDEKKKRERLRANAQEKVPKKKKLTEI